MTSRAAHLGGIVALAGALPVEVAGLRRLGCFKGTNKDGIEYLEGDVRGTDAALFVSGMGDVRAYETARAACRLLPVRAYVSIGMSGSLHPGLKPGDVVVGDRIKTLGSGGFSEYRSDPRLVELASTAFASEERPMVGPLLASDRVVVAAKEKMELMRLHGCLAIDMESAGAARAAKKAGVPFIAIRAISDGLDEDLPVDFNRFTVDGAMDWPRFIFHIMTHPAAIGPLAKLGRDSRLAVGSMTRVLGLMLARL